MYINNSDIKFGSVAIGSVSARATPPSLQESSPLSVMSQSISLPPSAKSRDNVSSALRELKSLVDKLAQSGSYLNGETTDHSPRSHCYRNFYEYDTSDEDIGVFGCFTKPWDRVFQGRCGNTTVNAKTGALTTTFTEDNRNNVVGGANGFILAYNFAAYFSTAVGMTSNDLDVIAMRVRRVVALIRYAYVHTCYRGCRD